MTTQDIHNVASAIIAKRGRVTVFSGGGWFDLTPELAVSFVEKSEVAFMAEVYEVSELHIVEWQKHNQDIRCHATTKAGKRGGNLHEFSHGVETFDKAVHSFCRIHGGKP